jgi:uncharacterized membrane-anchored protein
MITLRIVVVVALQTLALAYMIYDRQTMLNGSRVVTLKVTPVDPRDIFRGDFVILSYAISRLEPPKIQGDDTFDYGDKVYVTLVRDGEVWNAAAIARDKPFAIQNGIVIKGTVDSFQTAEPTATTPAPDAPSAPASTEPRTIQTAVTVTYGIESYFVPEGTGREIEEELRKGDLSVDVAIDAQGRTAIKAMRRKGKVFYVDGVF